MMRKFIIILSSLLLVGCTSNVTSNMSYESLIMDITNTKVNYSNTLGKGFKYYKPRDFNLYNDSEFNHTLINKGNKYYLNVDINGYYNKYEYAYTIDDSYTYSKSFTNNDKFGYLEIREGKNSYFYIKMMYNYSYIEVSVKKSELTEAVVNSMIILSSIKYNDKVIENFIGIGGLDAKETLYELKKPKDNSQKKNILDVYEKDLYTESSN